MSKVNKAPIKWAQRSDSLYITIALPGKLREVPDIRVSFVSSALYVLVAPATGSSELGFLGSGSVSKLDRSASHFPLTNAPHKQMLKMSR